MLLLELVREYDPRSEVPFGLFFKERLRWRLHNLLRRERKRSLALVRLDSPEVKWLAERLEQGAGIDFRNPRLAGAFKMLSPRQRLVLERLFWEEKSIREIASELRLTRQAVGGVKRRALKRLGEQLGRQRR